MCVPVGVCVFSGVIERWELLQAQARSNLLSGLREPCQLTSDLRDITSWLGWVTSELERVQVPETPTSIQDMEARVKQLKVRLLNIILYYGVHFRTAGTKAF